MNHGPLVLDDPLDMDDARKASRALAQKRRAAEKMHEDQVEKAARAEAEYRKALARAFVDVTDGSAAQREAVARASVAHLSYERDLAVGLVKAFTEQLRGLEGERSMLKSLIEFSARLNLDGRERVMT